jgi:bis(5'-nucleosyl)-tetraphosphatase (symmetrical)
VLRRVPGYAPPVGVRTIVVGDVHGCLEELDELLRVVELRPGFDRLVFVGDLIDRGPDSVGVVRRARELRARSVLGNHEEKHLRWARAGSPHAAPRATAGGRLSPADLAWLEALPPWLRLDGGWAVVHGGFTPARPLAGQRKGEVVRLRLVDDRGDMVVATRGAPPEGAAPWATRWRGPESVVYGHQVHDLDAPRVDEPAAGVRCVGLDTGCCYGGRLSALLLPAEEIVSVAAREPYARRTR